MARDFAKSVKRIPVTHLWSLAVLMAMLWIAMGTPLPPLDFWWHLKAGEVIWTTASIPRVDTFSFTASGRDFVYQSWLSQVIYYLTYLRGGFPMLVLLHAVTIALSFGVVLSLSWEITESPRIAALCTLAGEVLAIRFTNARPQIFSMLLFAIFYLLLERYRRCRGPAPWVLVPLMALWANMHGAFVLGIGLALLLTGTELGKALFAASGAISRRRIAQLSLICLLLILASLLNPEGWRVYGYVWDVQTDPASQKLVTEWQSPSLRNAEDITFFAAIFLGFLAFIYSTKRDLTNLVLFSAFAALGLASLRGIIWFALILPPVLATQLKELDLVPIRRALQRWLALRRSGSTMSPSPVFNLMLITLLAGITVVLSPWIRPRFPLLKVRSELVDSRIPREAMEFIAREGIEGPMFHPQEVGDYLIWRLYPQQRSFVDGRVHLYSEELCGDYVRILNGCGWEALLAKYRVQWVLLPQDEANGLLRRGLEETAGWELVYRDDQAVLYRKAPSG